MAQVTSGIRALLSRPMVYSTWQSVIGAATVRRATCSYLPLRAGQKILDVGCGPAEILDLLPGTEYTGVDLNPIYIEKARQRYGPRGRFLVGNVYTLESVINRSFDIIMAQSLLHHLDDDEAAEFFDFSSRKLRPGGVVLTVDPCRTEAQGPLARFLVAYDRGQNIRTSDGYEQLAKVAFPRGVRHHLRSDLMRLPYTLCYLVAAQSQAQG